MTLMVVCTGNALWERSGANWRSDGVQTSDSGCLEVLKSVPKQRVGDAF